MLRECRRCHRSLTSNSYEGSRKTCINCSNRTKMLRVEKNRKKEDNFTPLIYTPWVERTVCDRHRDFLKYPSRVNNLLTYKDGRKEITMHGVKE